MLGSVYPYFLDFASQRLLIDREPVPVYSCWNGAVSISLEPFLKVGHVAEA